MIVGDRNCNKLEDAEEEWGNLLIIAVAEGQTECEACDRMARVMDKDHTGSFDSLNLPAGQVP